MTGVSILGSGERRTYSSASLLARSFLIAITLRRSLPQVKGSRLTSVHGRSRHRTFFVVLQRCVFLLFLEAEVPVRSSRPFFFYYSRTSRLGNDSEAKRRKTDPRFGGFEPRLAGSNPNLWVRTSVGEFEPRLVGSNPGYGSWIMSPTGAVGVVFRPFIECASGVTTIDPFTNSLPFSGSDICLKFYRLMAVKI